ncbi:MAG: CAP domain-containing protein [Pseudomonadota bacterium]
MFRVIGSAAVSVLTAALAVAGCSTGSSQLSTGFAPDYNDNGLSRLGPSAGSTGTSRQSPGTRVASLDDRAPRGTFERAPAGALADRDYSNTTLDAEKARVIINQYRADNGLRPLRLDASLTAAATAHARDLAKWDRISHYGSDGSNPWDRVKRTGYEASLAAENVGTGQIDFAEVMRGWKASAGHNKNLLLRDANHMGIALVQAPNTEFKSFWTLVLGSKS